MAFGDAVRSESELRALLPEPTRTSHRRLGPATGAGSLAEAHARLDESHAQRLW
jgi:hypothetical protein